MKSWLVSLSLVSFCIACPSIAFGQSQQTQWQQQQMMWKQQQMMWKQQQMMWQQQQAMWKQQLQQQKAAQTSNGAKANSGYQQSKLPAATYATQQLQQQKAPQTSNSVKANAGFQQSNVPVAKSATSQANTYGYPRPEGYAWLTGTTVNYWTMTPSGPKVTQIKNASGYDTDHDYRKGQPNLYQPNGGLFQSDHQWTMQYPYTQRQDAFAVTPVGSRR